MYSSIFEAIVVKKCTEYTAYGRKCRMHASLPVMCAVCCVRNPLRMAVHRKKTEREHAGHLRYSIISDDVVRLPHWIVVEWDMQQRMHARDHTCVHV